jgi:outer membrane protein
VKHFIILLFAVLPLATLSAQAPKFGHIDINQLFMVMPEYNTIQKTLDSETAKLESQFTDMREELQKLESDYAQNAASLSQQQRQAKEAEYMTMLEKVQAFFTESQQKLQQRQQELQQPVIEKLHKAVDDVGAEEGFLYIFQVTQEVSFTLYRSAQSIDVTPLVKKKLSIQ